MTRPKFEFDHDVIGCAFCHRKTEEVMMYVLPAPGASLDSRTDARLHDKCYWRLVNIIRAAIGAPPVVRDRSSEVHRLRP